METATPDELSAAGARATRPRTLVIETFDDNWEKEWFTYKPSDWARSTHKLVDATWASPADALLTIDVFSKMPNTLVVQLDQHAAEIPLSGGEQRQQVTLAPKDFEDAEGVALARWDNVKRLKYARRRI